MKRNRIFSTTIHFAISCAIATLAALVVFLIWYPDPYWKISGGMKMFLALVSIDVIIGPLLTFTIFTPQKSRRALVFDIVVIGALQFSALTYGLWSLSMARPAYLVFENNQFTIVRAIDILSKEESPFFAAIRSLSNSGPKIVALRPFKDAREQFDFTMEALSGVPLATRTDLWRPYEASIPIVLKVGRPVSQSPKFSAHLALNRPDLAQSRLVYLPLQVVQGFWTVILDENAKIVDFVEMEPFE